LTETPVIDRIPRLSAGKKVKNRKPPRPTLETPRTQILLPQTRSGWLKAVGIVAGGVVVLVAALAGIRLVTETGCSEFTTEVTSVRDGGLQINVQPSDLVGSFGVKMSVIAPADFGPQARSVDAQAAANSIPQNLTPQGNFVAVQKCSVNPKHIELRMTAPPDAVALDGLDLYGWNSSARTWGWIGGEIDAQTREIVAHTNEMPEGLMLMKTASTPPIVGIDAPSAQLSAETWAARVPPSAAEASVPGMYVGDLGGVTFESRGIPAPGSLSAQVLPVIRNWGANGEVNRTLVRNMLASPEARQTHIAQLLGAVERLGHAGLEVDYRAVDPAQAAEFVEFITDLGRELSAKGKSLTVVVPAPAIDGAGVIDTPGYALRRIGATATQVKLDLSTNPSALMGEPLDRVISWATGQVNRYKLQLVVPTLGIRQDANGRTMLVGLEEALIGLGKLGVEPPVARPGSTMQLKWRVGTSPTTVNYDPTTSAYSYNYLDERGIQQTVWLGTTASLKRILERVSQHTVRGVTLRGALDVGNDEGIFQVIDGYVRRDLASAPVPEARVKVAFSTGTPFNLSLNNNNLEVQAPGGEGTYTLNSVFESGRQVRVGSINVQVSKDAPLPGGGATTATATSAVTTTTDAALAQSAPNAAATAMPGVKVDVFELGGVVNDLMHTTQMKGAGMSWVKTEVRSMDIPTEFIANVRAKGMKMLVTAIGDRARVMDEGYRDEWAAFLGRLAAAGVDAIEVWSEPNYDGDWPIGQINGASYTDLLKRAYAAIKQANPNTLVISAAMAQTSGAYSGGCDEKGCDELAFLGQMAAAGAQEAMDCVGAHYTVGYEAPTSVGVNHYSLYFEPLRNAVYGSFNGAKPICFTALGYISPEGFEGAMPTNYSFATGTTVANHAAWLAEAAKMSKDSGKIRLMIVWHVDSTTWRSGEDGDPQAGYAMIRPDGTCPACETLRTVMGAQ
jgi:hypothetical protein